MCGIVGGINLPELPKLASGLLALIAHRGPDAEGLQTEDGPGGTVVLGSRRLSIIDLSSAGNQPIEKDGRVIVFNGEIYNYRELTSELKQLGAQFRTHSDNDAGLEALY